MTFKSMADLERYVLSKAKDSLFETQNKIEEILREFIEKFYNEYSPDVYERTYQLFSSYIKTDVVRTGKGYRASIYFDASTMSHALKGLQSYGYYDHHGWSEEKILDTALVGGSPHGGYAPAGGTGIWKGSIPVITQEALNYLKSSLIANGIPVK
jgi:glucan phosphorylase